MYQPGKNLTNAAGTWCYASVGSTNVGTTSTAENVIGVDAAFTSAGVDLNMKHTSNAEKCTWFLASEGTHSSSFQLTSTALVTYQLHWVEWQAGNIASADLLANSGGTENSSFYPGLMPASIDK